MIVIHLTYTGTNGSALAFVRQMEASGTADDIRREDGCLGYDYYVSVKDPESVLLIDRWRDQAAIDAHHASPMMARIAALRERYDLHMQAERLTDAGTLPENDRRYIRK